MKGNLVYIDVKMYGEFDVDYGKHYAALIKHLEEHQRIMPGDKISFTVTRYEQAREIPAAGEEG